jgi:hypothetical protein
VRGSDDAHLDVHLLEAVRVITVVIDGAGLGRSDARDVDHRRRPLRLHDRGRRVRDELIRL